MSRNDTMVSFTLTFTADEQIQFLEDLGYTIVIKQVSEWYQEGPYDSIGQWRDIVKLTAKKNGNPEEPLDRVFYKELHARLRRIALGHEDI